MIVDRTHQCDGWRARIEVRHDEGVRPRDAEELDTHLGRCAPCRAYADDLIAIREWIRSEPSRPLPSEALEEIWEQTIERTAGSAPGRRARAAPFGLAAAAVLVVAVGAVLVIGSRPSGLDGYTEAELDRLDRDLRIAMAHLGNTLASAERITVEEVLVGEAATALRHLPLSAVRNEIHRETTP